MRAIFIGPPGAGKGTQAVLIAKAKGVPHISTGDMVREAIASKSELGEQIRAFNDAGKLVPDAVMIDLVRARLARPDCRSGFLLDGFPRTVDQAKALDEMLGKEKIALTDIVELDVAESVLLERIRSRSAGSGRVDDNLKVAATRLKVYWEQTAPVAKYYSDSGKLSKVDGLGTVEEVTERIQKVIRG
jgi:adenylate kinase